MTVRFRIAALSAGIALTLASGALAQSAADDASKGWQALPASSIARGLHRRAKRSSQGASWRSREGAIRRAASRVNRPRSPCITWPGLASGITWLGLT